MIWNFIFHEDRKTSVILLYWASGSILTSHYVQAKKTWQTPSGIVTPQLTGNLKQPPLPIKES